MRTAFPASVLAAFVPLAACVGPLPGSDVMPTGGVGATAGSGQAAGAANVAGTAGSSGGASAAGGAAQGGNPFVFVDAATVTNNVAAASKYVYWADGTTGAVMKASSQDPIPLVPSRFNPNTWVGVDAESVYWSTGAGLYATDIMKASVDGGPPTTIVSGTDVVERFAVGRDAVYWTTDTGKVWKIGLAGGQPTLLASRISSPIQIAVDAVNVYWLCNAGIMKVSVSGGQPVVLAPDGAVSFAIGTTDVYWVNGAGNVMKVGIDGGAPALAYAPPDPAVSVAADASGVYWTDATGTVYVGLSPTSARPLGTSGPYAIAFGITLDEGSVYWTAGGRIYRAAK